MTDFLKATANVPPSFVFDGRRIRAGDQFVSNSRRMTETLLSLGIAERDGACQVSAEDDVAAFSGVDADAPQPSAPKDKRGRPRKHQYNRRDLRADD